MIGVKTAIIGFIFVCLVFPGIVRSRTHFYWALAASVLGMLLMALAAMFSYPVVVEEGVQVGGFWRACYVINIFLDIIAVLLLVLAAGGLTARQLAGDMARAYEVMRRGETEKTVIIPPPGQPPGSQKREAEEDEGAPRRYAIEDPTAGPAYPKKDADQDRGSIPLE